MAALAKPVSPAKLVLLAVHFATHANLESLASLVATHYSVLRSDLILRILLTYLPETLEPAEYVSLVRALAAGDPPPTAHIHQVSTSATDGLSDEEATEKVQKLYLLRLNDLRDDHHGETDQLAAFLLLRGTRMDTEAGMLAKLPALLSPFLHQSPAIQTWMISTIVPLARRNLEFYPQQATKHSLAEFQNLPDRVAVDYLLAETGRDESGNGTLGRDMRSMVGPWLHNPARWKTEQTGGVEGAGDDGESTALGESGVMHCPGWEQALEWLTTKASQSWRVAVGVIEQWDGPSDVDLGADANAWLHESQQSYLDRSYARAALAVAYLIPDASVDALDGSYRICSRMRSLMDEGGDLTLQSAASSLPSISRPDDIITTGAKTAAFMRHDLLKPANSLTEPRLASLDLLMALILSAFLLTRAGSPCTIRKAGDLAFLQNMRDQKMELTRLLRMLSDRAPKKNDDFWIRARDEILWLHNWGVTGNASAVGVFGMVPRDFIETEFLKALLSHGRYTLARSLYEQSPNPPIKETAVRDTIQTAALNAFDNATNPNRTRGGLKKCDEIIHSFPQTAGSSPSMRRIEALLKAAHALSDYRLVLKQGEPFSPVVLRVHSDPISILDKVLEQNAKAYTRIQEFLEIGIDFVQAGLSMFNDPLRCQPNQSNEAHNISIAEKRITALCIDSALKEDDFETAYSYVVSRLSPPSTSTIDPSEDVWSWKAALNAGKYVRTEKSQKPTHLGTASGNPEIRHLEQRIECLATALRIAPVAHLQEVLKTFRRCEEQLDSAIREEAAEEDAWNAAGDLHNIPGAFQPKGLESAYPPRNITASETARQAEESPMSLFDLSRATARVAQRNFTALSNLQGAPQIMHSSQTTDTDNSETQRVRKRDQLREAATGTLVSGVGWLIGANVNRPDNDHT